MAPAVTAAGGARHLPSEPGLTQFQVFLKQVNSSLVDSNMLVRCVTLSLDRFENQVDMKGETRPEHQHKSVRCGLPGVKVVALWVVFFAAFTFLRGACFL